MVFNDLFCFVEKRNRTIESVEEDRDGSRVIASITSLIFREKELLFVPPVRSPHPFANPIYLPTVKRE
jgi:hypothetical protein